MKTFKIPVVWQVYGVMHIEAESLQQAKGMVFAAEQPLPDGNYIDDSVELDNEEIINQMNPE